MFTRYWIVLLVLAVDVNAVDPCQTPNGQNGDCKPINQCQSLFAQFKRGQISARTTEFLRKSQCGFVGAYPKICCPIGTSASPATPQGADLLPNDTVCGISTLKKIVGGSKTDINEFPWMALLEFEKADGKHSFKCGGSLINKRYVLTAAHCIPGLVSVRLGEYNTETAIDCIGNQCAPAPLNIPVEEKMAYRIYNSKDINRYHDIALVRLSRDVEFNEYVKPICLPTTEDEISKSYVGERLVVSGWGFTEKGFKSSIKLKVDVPVTDLSECIASFKSNSNLNLALNMSQLCAGGEAGKDSCGGDSGGPLMTIKTNLNGDFRWYAIGVVSFGPTPCGQVNQPGVYVKVANYVSWIIDQLED